MRALDRDIDNVTTIRHTNIISFQNMKHNKYTNCGVQKHFIQHSTLWTQEVVRHFSWGKWSVALFATLSII